ncbi:MAG: Gx transporter family protein [Solobacterium sp.]|jgi:heptaprenyl diphosphate synthase|nr:Gx transporter family protein [Solobacterium sp.]
MRINRTRHLAYLALLSAMAITLNMIETAYIGPIFLYLRLGLANIIALVAIKLLGVSDMIIVNVMRVCIGGLLSGTFLGMPFWIGAGGVLLSSIVLIIMDRIDASLIFTSVMSSIAHSVGQLVIVLTIYHLMSTIEASVPLLAYMLLGSIPLGLLTGYVAGLVLKRIKPLRIQKPKIEKTKEEQPAK